MNKLICGLTLFFLASCSSFSELSVFFLDREAAVPALYVSDSGSDGNPGTQAAPFYSIARALRAAAETGTNRILVGQCEYQPGSGLETNGPGLLIVQQGISLTGGWNAGFTAQTGYTRLNARLQYNPVLMISNSTGITLSGFEFLNATNLSTGLCGGGLVIDSSSEVSVSGCLFVSNTLDDSASGGGLWMRNNTNVTVSGEYIANRAGFGAAVYLHGQGTVTGSVFRANSALSNGAGVYITGEGPCKLDSCSFVSNSAAAVPADIFITGMTNTASSISTNTFYGLGNCVTAVYITNSVFTNFSFRQNLFFTNSLEVLLRLDDGTELSNGGWSLLNNPDSVLTVFTSGNIVTNY